MDSKVRPKVTIHGILPLLLVLMLIWACQVEAQQREFVRVEQRFGNVIVTLTAATKHLAVGDTLYVEFEAYNADSCQSVLLMDPGQVIPRENTKRWCVYEAGGGFHFDPYVVHYVLLRPIAPLCRYKCSLPITFGKLLPGDHPLAGSLEGWWIPHLRYLLFFVSWYIDDGLLDSVDLKKLARDGFSNADQGNRFDLGLTRVLTGPLVTYFDKAE